MEEVPLEEAAGREQRGAPAIDETCRRETSGAVRCAWLPGKGCVLLAGRRFRQGDEILVEPPLLRVSEPPQTPAFRALEDLCTRRAAELPLEPLWYWLVLSSLTEAQRGAPAEALGLPPAVPEETQRRLLLLYGARLDEPEAPPEPPDGGRFAEVLAEAVQPEPRTPHPPPQRGCWVGQPVRRVRGWLGGRDGGWVAGFPG